jgi:hypothetical protein
MEYTRILFDKLNRIPADSPIPDDGELGYIHGEFHDAGQYRAIPLNDGFVILYLNFEEIISEMSAALPGWHVESDSRRVAITMIFPETDIGVTIPLLFDRNEKTGADFLRAITIKKKITICFLYLMYGDLYKGKTVDFDVPDDVIGQISAGDRM